MRTHSLVAFAVALGGVLSASRGANADCGDPFGHPEQVLDFHLRMSRGDWEHLLASQIPSADAQPTDSPACSASFPKFRAAFRCGNESWIDVTVRKKKGEERGIEAFEKPPLKIDFGGDDEGAAGGRSAARFPPQLGSLGFGSLTLNNGQSNKYGDKTAVLPVLQSEHVALRLMQGALPLTPESAYATVTVHFDDAPLGVYQGVYIVIEDIDRRALRRRGLSGNGRLEKASTYNCSPEVEFDDGSPNAATAAFTALLSKDPADYAGQWAKEAELGVDVDTALRQEAAREILVNGSDTLFNSQNPTGWGNNWYAYDAPDGKRQYIPWDLDLAFGQQAGACQPTPLQCPASVPLLTWCTGVGGSYPKTLSRLGLRLACQPELTGRYLQTMCALIQGPLSAETILGVWNQTYETLAPVVPRESERAWGGIDPLAPPTEERIIETFGSEHARLARWIPERVAFVREELARLGTPCPPR